MPSPPRRRPRDPAATRRRLVDAAMRLILRQGYAATTVDGVCAEAGMTKGSFFHHFADKEAIGRAAVESWGGFGAGLYAEAWKDGTVDPVEQMHRLLGIMSGFTERPEEVCTCVVGMLSQEVAQSHPGLREACARELGVWTANVARMLAAAKRRHRPRSKGDPEAMAWFLNSLWQGSMLVAKACQSPAIIRRNLALAREIVDLHFGPAPRRGSAPARRRPARVRSRSSRPLSSRSTKPLRP